MPKKTEISDSEVEKWEIDAKEDIYSNIWLERALVLIQALRKERDWAKVARDVLENIDKHCQCTRALDHFDYGAHPEPGKRWLLPKEIARSALRTRGDMFGEEE